MKKKIAEKWVEALRSDEYIQGDGTLRNPETNAFCCLGVLCNLHAQAHPQIASIQYDPGTYIGEQDLLPMAVRDWAGMNSVDGVPNNSDLFSEEISTNGKDYYSLTEANDDGVTFAEIADWIEKNYKEL